MSDLAEMAERLRAGNARPVKPVSRRLVGRSRTDAYLQTHMGVTEVRTDSIRARGVSFANIDQCMTVSQA